MTLEVYTSMYSYKGDDRLDITAKGQDPIGKIFAPMWYMVQDYKKNRDRVSYMDEYYRLMIQSYRDHKDIWKEILSRDKVTFVCFCYPGFCHRFLLKDYLVRLGAKYMGEV